MVFTVNHHSDIEVKVCFC